MLYEFSISLIICNRNHIYPILLKWANCDDDDDDDDYYYYYYDYDYYYY